MWAIGFCDFVWSAANLTVGVRLAVGHLSGWPALLSPLQCIGWGMGVGPCREGYR